MAHDQGAILLSTKLKLEYHVVADMVANVLFPSHGELDRSSGLKRHGYSYRYDGVYLNT